MLWFTIALNQSIVLLKQWPCSRCHGRKLRGVKATDQQLHRDRRIGKRTFKSRYDGKLLLGTRWWWVILGHKMVVNYCWAQDGGELFFGHDTVVSYYWAMRWWWVIVGPWVGGKLLLGHETVVSYCWATRRWWVIVGPRDGGELLLGHKTVVSYCWATRRWQVIVGPRDGV